MDGIPSHSSCQYSLRTIVDKPDYRVLVDVKLPRTGWRTNHTDTDRELYTVRVVERDTERGLFRVHYTGYNRQYDEWKERGELVPVNEKGQ